MAVVGRYLEHIGRSVLIFQGINVANYPASMPENNLPVALAVAAFCASVIRKHANFVSSLRTLAVWTPLHWDIT